MLKRAWAPISLAVLVFVAYANVYGNAFLFDDEFLVLRNEFLNSWTNLGRIFTSSSTAGAGFRDSFYRPLQGLSYLCITQLFGGAPWAFHALNVGLHAANALLVYRLGRTLKLMPMAAWLAAALWAAHPLHVEAITYVSATADPLHALFVLLALNVAAPTFTSGRMWAAALLGLAGVLAKESAIVYPALLGAVIFALSPERSSWRPYVKTWPAWLTAGAYYVLRRLLLHFDDANAFFATPNAYADHWFTRLYTSLATLPSYLELLAWPHDLHMDRDFPTYADPAHAPVVLGALVAMLGLSTLAWAWRRPGPTSVFAAFVTLWIAAAHAPHSGVLIAVNSVFLEHWMYLTSIALFLAVGRTLARARWAQIVGVLMIVGLAQKTVRQNEVWATPISFFTHTLNYSPKSARIRHNLAIALSDQGDDDHALEQYELMIKAGTTYAQTFHNAGLIYLKRGATGPAETNLLRALELDPKFYPSAQYLSVLYASRGEREKSARYLEMSKH